MSASRRVTPRNAWIAAIGAAFVIYALALGTGLRFSQELSLILSFATPVTCLAIYFLFRPGPQTAAAEVPRSSTLELVAVLAWLLAYMALWCVSETTKRGFMNEATNWITLVLIPLAIVAAFEKPSVRRLPATIGFLWKSPRRWVRRLLVVLLVFAPFVIAATLVHSHLGLSDIGANLASVVATVSVYFVLMLFMAGLTEEIFFRGVLQRLLEARLGSGALAVLLSSLLFALYHLPFAYLAWPTTRGNLMYGLTSVLSEQFVSGLLYGFAYHRTRNLWVPVCLHALNNAIAFGVVHVLVR